MSTSKLYNFSVVPSHYNESVILLLTNPAILYSMVLFTIAKCMVSLFQHTKERLLKDESSWSKHKGKQDWEMKAGNKCRGIALHKVLYFQMTSYGFRTECTEVSIEHLRMISIKHYLLIILVFELIKLYYFGNEFLNSRFCENSQSPALE